MYSMYFVCLDDESLKMKKTSLKIMNVCGMESEQKMASL